MPRARGRQFGHLRLSADDDDRASAQGHGGLGRVPLGRERASDGGFVRGQALEERRSLDRRRRMIRIAISPQPSRRVADLHAGEAALPADDGFIGA